jgi:hypothetical protein
VLTGGSGAELLSGGGGTIADRVGRRRLVPPRLRALTPFHFHQMTETRDTVSEFKVAEADKIRNGGAGISEASTVRYLLSLRNG